MIGPLKLHVGHEDGLVIDCLLLHRHSWKAPCISRYWHARQVEKGTGGTPSFTADTATWSSYYGLEAEFWITSWGVLAQKA